MSCRELERLLAAAVSAEEIAAHRAGCRTCAREASDIDETERLTAALTPPVWSASLREALLTIPATTVSCEDAAAFIAVAVDSDPGELSRADRSRLDFHLRRCDGCREALDTLAGVSELVEPQPAPWFPARLAASRPVKRRSGWRGLLDPRAAIGFAYGSALVVMLAGFNPADLARKAGANLRTETRTASTKATVASGSLADRVGAFQDRVNRKFAVLRGRAGGYGRAILSNAVSLVMKSSEPPPAPSRPRNGQDRVMPKNPTGTQTWASLRAGTTVPVDQDRQSENGV